MSGFTLMLLGMPMLDGLGLVSASVSWLPGINDVAAPLGIYFVYAGVFCSLATGGVYTVKGIAAIRAAIAHPEDEDDDFLNPEIEDSDDAEVVENA